MMNVIHNANYKVRMSDSDYLGSLKLPSLLQMLQEAATEHAQNLGLGFKEMKEQNLGWALSKLIVDINRVPRWGERIDIKTWPSFRERIATYREFSASDKQGESVFTARSQWLIFDISARKLARMDRLHQWTLHPETANESTFDVPFEKVSNFESESVKRSKFFARSDDIDLNGHVNNAVFLIWAIESLPENVYELNMPKRLKISFLEEVLPHTEVSSFCEQVGQKTITTLVNPKTNREHARICIDWQSK